MTVGAASTCPTSVAGPPLDYSFKELKSCAEIETEEPRSGGRRRAERDTDSHGRDGEAADTAQGEGRGGGSMRGPAQASRAAASSQMKRVLQKVTIAVKLNNNSIDTITDLPVALESAMDDPLRNLQWIDLSFNQLTTIEPALLQFTQMKALYLHGNRIKALQSVERLRQLKLLISLTLNGNPIESTKCYRAFVIGALDNLRTLDHTSITEDELEVAKSWYVGHLRREKEHKQRLEDAKMASND